MARRSRALVVAALALAITPSARAHVGHLIGSAERYLKLDVSGHDARVVVSLTLGAREGGRVLMAADANEDGEVSEAERDDYLARWARGLATELPVTIDGDAVELAWGEPFMDPIGPVRNVPVTVELVAHVALAGGTQTVRITDAMVRREVYDRTDVAFRTREGAELVASGMGDEVHEPTPDIAYGAELARERVVLTAVVTTPPGAMATPTMWAVAGGVVLLALVVALLWRARRARSRS